MERIIIKHISGSKANQVETFASKEHPELTLGRDPSLEVKFDPERDDLISRKHAKIACHYDHRFTITDLKSRNGTFLNKKKISETTEINHGDVIQLGWNGPEFIFELDPPPLNAPRTTRIAEHQAEELMLPSREARAAIPPPVFNEISYRHAVGQTVFDRLLSQYQSKTRKYLFTSVAVLLSAIVLAAGVFIYTTSSLEQQVANPAQTARPLADTEATPRQAEAEEQATKPIMSPKEIAENYSPATVYIEVSWKLVDPVSGRQVYHRYLQTKGKKGGKPLFMPAYIRLPDGTVEPWLVTDDGAGKNRPIGGIHTGSGFVVTENGFILTNRHVVASWYTQERLPLPGVVFNLGSKGDVVNPRRIETYEGNLDRWVPAKSALLEAKNISPKWVEGKHDRLDVTFFRNRLRIPAKLVRISDEHDAALIKIDAPQSVKKVELNDNYDAIKAGDAITILSYTGLSPKNLETARSQDFLNPVLDTAAVPDPAVTPGIIGKVIRGTAKPGNGEKYDYYSESDSYQLTTNVAGAGSSGGAVFDEYGKVIGIFYAGAAAGANDRVTFAVPIKFGIDLMRISPIL